MIFILIYYSGFFSPNNNVNIVDKQGSNKGHSTCKSCIVILDF